MFRLAIVVVSLTLLPTFGAMPIKPTPSMTKVNTAFSGSENSSFNSCACTSEKGEVANGATPALAPSEEEELAAGESQSGMGCDCAKAITTIAENESETRLTGGPSSEEETQTTSPLLANESSALSSEERAAKAAATESRATEGSGSLESNHSPQISIADCYSVENADSANPLAYHLLYDPGLLDYVSFNEESSNFIFDTRMPCPPGYSWASKRCRKRV